MQRHGRTLLKQSLSLNFFVNHYMFFVNHCMFLNELNSSYILQVYFKATDPFNERWQSAWMITAFWDILAFALLCVICYLWAPSQTSQRYGYSLIRINTFPFVQIKISLKTHQLVMWKFFHTLCSGQNI